MNISESEISFYVDTLIVETLLSNKDLYKNAQESGLANSLIQKTKEYFSNQIDPDDKTGSVLNLLAPGAISTLFSAMGFSWLGMLFGLAMRVFHIDVTGILSSLYQTLKGELGGGNKQLSSPQVQSMVDKAIQEHGGQITEEDLTGAMAAPVTSSVEDQLNDARWLKLGLISYEMELNKKQGNFKFAARRWSKPTTVSILGKVLGWIFKIALSSAGLLVAGDVVNKFLGRPNAFDNTVQKGRPIEVAEKEVLPTQMSFQTKFPINPGYVDTRVSGNWIERASNTESGIQDLLIRFAKEVYSGLNDSDIKSSSSFNKIVSDIAWYNHAAAGDQVVFIPRSFTSKKQLVDHFIDEVAAKAS